MSAKLDVEPKQFDWESAKRRIYEAGQALSQVDMLTKEQADELMRRRASQLAQVPALAPDTSQIIEVVRFRIAGESVAIATRFVLELTRPRRITPVPMCDDALVGVVNLRGDITSVWDLRHLLNLDGKAEQTPRILVLGRVRPELAIVVDEIEHIAMLRSDELLEPIGGIGNAREWILGCTRNGSLVLDGDALLDCEELFIEQTD